VDRPRDGPRAYARGYKGTGPAAPSGYEDRTTLATGGGAELSFYGFNMDFVYALTVHDTAKARQPLGANPIFQMSYDLHF
jgi:hypothetical protein